MDNETDIAYPYTFRRQKETGNLALVRAPLHLSI
jgi:hypothetical protein